MEEGEEVAGLVKTVPQHPREYNLRSKTEQRLLVEKQSVHLPPAL